MKAKRKNRPTKQRRVGLLFHTAIFFFASSFYMVWWFMSVIDGVATFPQLLAFLLTWLGVLLLHTISVPFFKWAHMGQSLWWRPNDYRARHLRFDIHLALFMSAMGFFDAWVISQMVATTTISALTQVAFWVMVCVLPLWLAGVLYHGHQVFVKDIQQTEQEKSIRYTRHLEVDGIPTDDDLLSVADDEQVTKSKKSMID